MGTYVEEPDIKIDWSKYAEHGFSRLEQRGMTQSMADDIIANGKVLFQNGGSKYAYISKEGVVVVSKDGKLITAWGKDNFDTAMSEIIGKLFGK